MVALERVPGSCGDLDAQMKAPPYSAWFQQRGVGQADFDETMAAVIQPINDYQSRVGMYTCVTLISCGAAGWCCQIAEGAALPGKIQVELDKFNAKYPEIKGAMSRAPPGLVFTGPQLAQAAPGQVMEMAAVPAGQVMARDQGTKPEEKLASLKSMLDQGLISQEEYDTKKKEILATM